MFAFMEESDAELYELMYDDEFRFEKFKEVNNFKYPLALFMNIFANFPAVASKKLCRRKKNNGFTLAQNLY